MSPTFLLTIYCGLILVASLVGGMVPLMIRMTHGRVEPCVSFVAGVMLGVGLLHMLPHALSELDSVDTAMWWLLIGFLTMFFVERFFHFHTHEAPSDEAHADESPHEPHRESVPSVSSANHSESNSEDRAHDCESGTSTPHDVTWSGAAVGLTLHSLIGGIALAASVEAEQVSNQPAGLVGFGTFIVIFLHKPFDSMTIGTLMAIGRWPVSLRHLVNVLFALVIPLGVLLFYVGAAGLTGGGTGFLGGALAFSAGTFLCIAMSDLLPELQFHRHDRAKLSAMLLAGLAVAWAVGLLETHDHSGHDKNPTSVGHDEHSSHQH